MSAIFTARNLTHRFGEKLALDGIDLDLTASSITGLIGRNGSGKTTLIRTIVGHLLPTTGSAQTFGTKAAQLGEAELHRMGAVFQENRLLDWMTVEDHLDFASHFHPDWSKDRERTLLEALELAPKDRVGNLSPGNSQKLALMLAVCSCPELLLLDEPVSSLDPIAREELLTLLLHFVREDDTTILISSHTLVDVERVVDRVLCLDRGRIVHEGILDDLLEGFSEWLVTANQGSVPERFTEDWVVDRRGFGRQALLLVRTGSNATHRQAEFAERHGLDIDARPANLERIFPSLVGRRPSLQGGVPC